MTRQTPLASNPTNTRHPSVGHISLQGSHSTVVRLGTTETQSCCETYYLREKLCWWCHRLAEITFWILETPLSRRCGCYADYDVAAEQVADLLRVLCNVNAVPADLTSMMMRRLIWLIVLSFCFAFIVTAAAGPVVAVVACAGVLIYALAEARGNAARRTEAAEAEAEAKAAAAETVIAEAESVLAAARLRLLGGAGY